jgi:aquaporin Z
MFSKRKIAALVAEFLGTAILAFIVLTVSHSQIGIPYFVAFAVGLVVIMLGLALQRDVQLNPALTLGLWVARRITTVKAVAFIVAQLLGGLLAYWLYKYFTRGVAGQPIPTAFDAHVLVAEGVGTFVLAFIAAGAIYQRQHWLIRSVATGGAFAIGIMVASAASAGFVNPAVALASNAWAWTTYVLGPVVGGVVGVNLYGLLFANKDRDVARAKSTSAATTVSTSKKDVDEESDKKDSTKSAKTATAATVEKHVKEDREAVPAHRLDKVEKAEKNSKKKKSRK